MFTVEASAPTKTNPKAPLTMAALQSQIMTATGLQGRKQKDICWALRTVPRAFQLEPDLMPADPSFISDRLKGFEPAMAGLGKGTWKNALTLTRSAFRIAGIIKTPVRCTEKFAPLWTELMKTPALKHDQIGLSRLARFCTDNGIDPDSVNDKVFADFLTDLTDNAIIKQPKKVHRRAATIWNKHVLNTRYWPTQTITVPSYSRAYFIGWDRFPETLVAEIESHLRRMSGEDILANLDVKPVKPGTIKTRRYQLGAYLSGLVLSGEAPENLKTLADAVEVERVRKGLRFLLNRAEKGATGQAHDTARMLISVARHEVKVGDKHLEALQAFCKRLDDGSPGMSDKNKTRLRQFDDPQHVWDLLGLPQALLDKAKKEVKREAGVVSQAAALRYQTALAIELLLMIPMRRENLTRLTVEKHIDRRRNGTALIIIPGTEVKNGVSIEAALPAHVIKMLDDYMKAYQPVLAKGASPWVFPGLPGRPKSRERMAFQVSETIKKEIGLQMHMHLFRHFAAKIYLDRNPGGYGVVQKLHGHKSIETTIRSYCGAEVKSAISHYDHQILKLRDEDLSNPKKPRG